MTDPLAKLVLIRERDVGLFSMVLQVLNTVYVLESQHINRRPVAMFGRGSVYFRGDGHEGKRTVWEYYFEPLTPDVSEEPLLAVLGRHAIELLESKRKQLERMRGAVEFPQEVHQLPALTNDDLSNIAELDRLAAPYEWAWTESFHPTIDGKRPASFEFDRAHGADLVRRYIRPREHVRQKVSQLFENRLQGHYVIGVHVRGTDGYSAPARGVQIPFDRYFTEIERHLAQVGRGSCRVFLATDEQRVVSLFEERLGETLVCYDARRSAEGDEAFGVGPTGQPLPGYLTKAGIHAARNGDDAVVEFLVLCQADFLVHNVSSLSFAARLMVDDCVQV